MKGDPELHITVVALTKGPGLEMTDEIALVKAALLYADRVTLASPKAILLASVASYLLTPPDSRHEVLMETVGRSIPEASEAFAAREEMRRIRHKTPGQIVALKLMEKKLEQSGRGVASQIEEMLEQAKASELELAMRAGVVDLDPLGADRLDEAYRTESLLNQVTKLIEKVFSPSSSTYPMFNGLTGDYARDMLAEGKLAGAQFGPATQAGIAGRFISALDAFPAAHMDVVLDARERLGVPLRKFRAGMVRLSNELGEIHPLDPHFPTASNDLYRQHIAPALEEIEELSQEMKLLPALARSSPEVAADIGRIAPVIAVAVTAFGGVGDLATLATGAAGAAADLIGRAAKRQRKLQTRRDKSEFVFLYEARRELRSR